MPFKTRALKASGVGAGPYAADYNRSYNTHTEHNASEAFANNDVAIADQGPYEYPGHLEGRRYVNPITCVPDVQHGNQYGYLGDTPGPREMQTGNAPSGGYMVNPGGNYTVGFQAGALPDNRRVAERSRGDDWEWNQAKINRVDLGGNRDFRRSEVRWAEEFSIPQPVWGVDVPVNAIEDSPYRRDWPEPNRLTMRTNPNPTRVLNAYDQASEFKNSGTRYNNGTHYSMAEHNSLTPTPMQTQGTPVRGLRNTYRLTPAPWDGTNTDGPANTSGYQTTTNIGGSDGAAGFGAPSYVLM